MIWYGIVYETHSDPVLVYSSTLSASKAAVIYSVSHVSESPLSQRGARINKAPIGEFIQYCISIARIGVIAQGRAEKHQNQMI